MAILKISKLHFSYSPFVWPPCDKVLEMRNDEMDIVVDISCQFLIQNSRTDRQVKHRPKKDDVFLQTLQTPLSAGLPLVTCIHECVTEI